LAVSGSADSEPGFNSPRLLPVPSTWWETPAVTSCVLAASPESARAARHFTREVLLSWGYGDLIDEAETIKNTDIAKHLALPPVKIHCSVLAEDAIKAAIADYRAKMGKKDAAE